jgi:hypothetical protein
VSCRALRSNAYFPIVPPRCQSLVALDVEHDAQINRTQNLKAKSLRRDTNESKAYVPGS